MNPSGSKTELTVERIPRLVQGLHVSCSMMVNWKILLGLFASVDLSFIFLPKDPGFPHALSESKITGNFFSAGANWKKWKNGKMWLPKSVGKTFPLQRNTSQNYSPCACWQNICRCNQESNQCWNHLLTTLTDIHCHLEYLNLHLISSRMFRLHLVINYEKISEHLWTSHPQNKYSWWKNAWGLMRPQYMCYGKPLKKHGSKASLCS